MVPDSDLTVWRERIAGHLGGSTATSADRDAIRRVDSAVGPLLFPAWDEGMLAAIESTRAWEPATTAWIQARLRDGVSAVVIGANVGYHTIAIARAVGPSGRVVAFEPDPFNFELLRANLGFNKITNVYAIPAAVGDYSGMTDFTLDDKVAGHHRAYRRSRTPAAGVIDVPIVKLDELLAGHDVDFVLSDTQTFDHRVIQGLRATVARCRPLMIVQYWPEALIELGDDPSAVIEFYRSLGYDIGVLEVPSFDHGSTAAQFVEFADTAPGRYLSLVLSP